MEACGHHLHTVPESPSARLRGLRPDRSIPADLEAIVLRCLAKSPADRHASATELLDALTACSIAGEWTEADARAACAASRDLPLPLVNGGRTETSWTAKTIAVDRVG